MIDKSRHSSSSVQFSEDRYLSPDPLQRRVARELYDLVKDTSIVSPHAHVDPCLLAGADVDWGTPVDALIIPDHSLFRMLYSLGISLAALGMPSQAEAHARRPGLSEREARLIWQTVADHFHLLHATPAGLWFSDQLAGVFDVRQPFTGQTAQAVFDQVAARLASPQFRPRALFERLNIEVLCTTDAATDRLVSHRQIRESDWGSRSGEGLKVRPTFRPDALFNLDAPGWRQELDLLSEVSCIDAHDYASFIRALENRRAFFKAMGATATDHAALTPFTEELTASEAQAIFARALTGRASAEDGRRFMGHLLMQEARMSIEDGLVMQLHAGAWRNHNTALYQSYGADRGGDIPVLTEWTGNLRPLLNRYGSDARLTLIVFTLDEATYSRELGPLASHYPALRVGPPWWYLDTPNGIRHYFDQLVESAGLYNTVGFNDDASTLFSIPARHDLWRRLSADWAAGLLVRGMISEEAAQSMVFDCAARLARAAYRL